MQNELPSGAEVAAALNDLGGMPLARLAKLTGSSLSTLHRIKHGKKPNPGIDTVRKFWPTVQTIRLVQSSGDAPARMTAKAAQ